jgi:hypothetical protein
MRNWLLALLASYVISALVIGLALGGFNLPQYWRLSQEGRSVRAKVTDTDCANHEMFSYTFPVGVVTYTGRGGAGFGTPPCSDLRPGDAVGVYYLPSRPETNLPGDIHQRLENEVTIVVLAALVLPAFLVGIEVWRWKRETRASAEQVAGADRPRE